MNASTHCIYSKADDDGFMLLLFIGSFDENEVGSQCNGVGLTVLEEALKVPQQRAVGNFGSCLFEMTFLPLIAVLCCGLGRFDMRMDSHSS